MWYKSSNCYVAHEEEKTQNKYKLVLCVDKYYQERKRTRESKNTKWVTVLPIWTGMSLLLEVKGQRYI